MQIKDYQVVILGVLIALGSVVSTYILSGSVVQFQKMQTQTIRVTGSASTNVTSDKASWSVCVKTAQPTLKEGYSKIEKDTKKVKSFFIENGIDPKNIETAAINSYENYKRYGNGYTSNEIENYSVSRYIHVKSDDIEKLTELSKKVNELVDMDIYITAESVEYFVSNLDEIKVATIEAAAKNAKQRAESLVKGTNGHIGVMTSAKTGVFQIVPVDSTAVDDYGINDTSSIEKKVLATVNATFTVK